MPLQTSKLHVNYQLLVTAELKTLVKLRQRAFVKGDKELFHLYRNSANRERKSCRASTLNPRKASGPDELPNWLLKEFAEVLAQTVCTMLNSSFREQKFPSTWKLANIAPLIITKPVTNVSKHLQPISLTSALSKVAEDFIVVTYISPAILSIIDPDQFGAIPNSSITYVLFSMIHNWAEATDATGAAVRIMLLDYRKALDLIDHSILANKICNLPIPPGIACWVVDFLTDRKQPVKLANDCYSEWGHVPSGVPQGTKLGPWLFLLMVNDLKCVAANKWKYVNDTNVAEVVKKGGCSIIQSDAELVHNWSLENNLQLNTEKCKEMIYILSSC